MRSRELRATAWNALKGKYWMAVLAALLAGLFGATVSGGSSVNFNFNIDSETLGTVLEEMPIILMVLVPAFALTGVLNLAAFVLGGVVQLGYCGFLLKQNDRESATIKDMFSQFERFGQGFLQALLRGIFIFLWSLLFIIPGIIKTYSYAMTPFIMAEHPEMKAKDAITASKNAMKGHKWELFCLSFSFIGWILLAVLTLGIGFIFLSPYMEAAYAAFYRDKISPKTAAVPCEEVLALDNPE